MKAKKILATIFLLVALIATYFSKSSTQAKSSLEGHWKIKSMDTPENLIVGGEDSFLASAINTHIEFGKDLKIGNRTFCQNKFSIKSVAEKDQFFSVLKDDEHFPGLNGALSDILKSCPNKSGKILDPADAIKLSELAIDECRPNENPTYLISRYFEIDSETMLAEYEGNYLCLKRQ